MNRPERSNPRLDEIRARMEKYVRENPNSGLVVAPRGFSRGPVCDGCGERVIGGPLHTVLLCSSCRRNAESPPPEAA